MKTSYSVIAVVAMSMAFGANATGVSQDRIPELQREARPDAKSANPTGATLTGCVARGTETGTYTLTNVTKEGEVTAKDAPERAPVVLSGTDVDVSKHVGHKVSVTGSYAGEERATGTTGTAKPAATAAVKEGDKKTSATFTVKSLKMVADSCSQPAN